MCVAIYKPHGIEIPSDKILKKCWDANSDGGGFAVLVQESKKKYLWQVQKGYMTWTEWKTAFYEQEFEDSDTLFMHFRIKSAGAVEPGQTHPFPVCDDYAKMKELQFTAENIVMHNGTCGLGTTGASDTMKFIKENFDPLLPYLGDKKVDDLLTRLVCDTRDRWCFGNGDTVWYYGKWETVDGVYYSNLGWRATAVYSRYQSGYGWYDDDADDPIITTKEGTVKGNGDIVWDEPSDTTTTSSDDMPSTHVSADANEDFILLCPNCFEDKYIGDSPYVDMGDSMCFKCGCVFDEEDGEIWMFDEDIKAGKQSYNVG